MSSLLRPIALILLLSLPVRAEAGHEVLVRPVLQKAANLPSGWHHLAAVTALEGGAAGENAWRQRAGLIATGLALAVAVAALAFGIVLPLRRTIRARTAQLERAKAYLAAAADRALMSSIYRRIMDANDVSTAMEPTLAALARHLGCERASYGEVLEDEGLLRVVAQHGGRPSNMPEEYHLEDFGTPLIEVLRQGRTMAISDVRTHPLTAPRADVFNAQRIRSLLCVPLVRQERFVAFLLVHRRQPRPWRRHEAALLEETAERLFLAVARIRTTERLHTARREAELANEAKSRFLAAASHDLRQPFQAMRLFHQVLLEGTSDPRQRKAVENLGAAMTAGEELLNILLDVSTLEAGNVVATVTEFPARDVLADQVVSLGPVAAEKGVALCMVPCDCTVRSDPVLLKRIVRNLAANAVRYTPPGGKVLIGCRHIGTSLRIEVWDTGCGIPADKLEQVFEDFFQLDNPERNRTKGLGLGLSIVRRTAALLGHPVTVRSWPNKGSVFAITLPATRATARPQAAGLVPASRYSGLNYELV